VGAAIVMGTDPDCDRMGIIARGGDGKMHLLTGNQIGSLMAYYRLKTMFDLGILNAKNKDHAILIKTFVTTELQRAIADKFGVTCINTLTGFKYIGQKLAKYERALGKEILKNYRELSEPETRALRLQHSKFFVFGGEESYGYLACDFTRDKDANAAAMMFAETVAYAESRGITIIELMDEIYVEFGYFTEHNANRTFEGAEGASKIAALAASYADSPPAECDGAKVTKLRNFGTEDIVDEEGEAIPKEKMLFVDLEDGRTFAVRPSGTEPKIKYYLFGTKEVPDAASLAEIKSATTAGLESLWAWLSADIDARLA
jgi:phosphoglucomutase